MKEVAEILLQIKAVSLDPNFGFTWASGIQSPIYCDNRMIISYPEQRKIITKAMIQLLQKHFPSLELLAGTATAGIPHASFAAYEMNLPMCYIRSKSKEHGKSKNLEGFVTQGQKCVIIEDLISTGKSSIAAAKVAQEAGLEVLGVCSIFTYSLAKADLAFAELGLKYFSLCSFQELAELAMQKDILNQNELQKIAQWLKTL